MKVKDALAIAASQFIQRFVNKVETVQLLEQFAIEELELTIQQARQFSLETVEGKATEWLNSEQEKRNFFTWYLLNHVELPKPSKD